MLKNEFEKSMSLNENHSFLSSNENSKKIFFISQKVEKEERDLNNKTKFLNKKHDKFIIKNKIKGRWTKEEQILFVDMILDLDNDWKKIQTKFTTRTIVQIRSHAQKFLIKLKNNSYLREKGLQKGFSWNKTIHFLKSIFTIEEIKHIFYSLCEEKRMKKKRKIKLKYDKISYSNLNDDDISNENKKMNNVINDENKNIDNNIENDGGIFDKYYSGKFDFNYIEQFIQRFNYNSILENDESSIEEIYLYEKNF